MPTLFFGTSKILLTTSGYKAHHYSSRNRNGLQKSPIYRKTPQPKPYNT